MNNSNSKKTIKINNNNKENTLSQFSSKSPSEKNYKSSFDFDIEEIYFFINEEELILNASQNFENEQLCKIIKKIYLNIIKSTNKLKKSNNKDSCNSIQFNIFYMNKFKLVLCSFANINITVLCLFDIVIKSSIIKFFMIYILLSLLNFLQRNTDITQLSILDTIIYSKIYESFMLLPLIRYFYLISENILNKHTIFFENLLHYKNFYLVNLDENNTYFFSFNNLHNIISKKIYNNKILWNELLFHSNNLKQKYLLNLGKISDDKEYQDYFVKIEYKAAHPYLIYVIRFLPLLDGIALIHEYETKKENIKYSKMNTNEFDIIKVHDIISITDEERCINEPKIMKERESFIYCFLYSSIPFIQFFYESKLITYYSEEILNIISKIVEKNELNSSLNFNYLLSIILHYLYNDYLKEIIQELEIHKNEKENKFKSKEDIIKRNMKMIDKINEDKFVIINNNQWNYSNYYHNQNLFKMTKIYYLLTLFKPTDNISRYNYNNNINVVQQNNKYEYINIDLKKGFHKSINLTMKFSYYNKSSENSDNNYLKNNSQSLNQILSKPISNYDGPTTFDSYESTNNITSDFHKTLTDDETFYSLKSSIFELKSCSIKKNN